MVFAEGGLTALLNVTLRVRLRSTPVRTESGPAHATAGAGGWRHLRLRAFELSISSEKPPVMPASIGDRYSPRSRSGLLVGSGSALASAAALLRVRGWARKCKAASIAEIGLTLVDA